MEVSKECPLTLRLVPHGRHDALADGGRLPALIIPVPKVYRGDERIEAGPDKELASRGCVFTPTSVTCSEGEGYSALRQLMEK